MTRANPEIDETRLVSDYDDSNSPSAGGSSPWLWDDSQADLIRRVLVSSTFEHCSRLKSFLEYVCDCALRNEPSAATEQMIGIHVFGRRPGYNTSQDNIVRSQARLLRLKLEHHFSNEGRREEWMITIPKGQYLPVLKSRPDDSETRQQSADIHAVRSGADGGDLAPFDQAPEPVSSAEQPFVPEPEKSTPGRNYWRITAQILLAVLGVLAIWYVVARPGVKSSSRAVPASVAAPAKASGGGGSPVPVAGSGLKIRISAGNTRGPYVDPAGQRWNADRFFEGGVSEPGPRVLFPPVADSGLFKSIREGKSTSAQGSTGFQYNIPAPPGVYQLKLYFADPLRYSTPGSDGQHLRYFQVNLNGRPILKHFDAIADAGEAPVDIRVFRGVSPAPDGKIHLAFLPDPGRPFVSALALSPGVPGKFRTIRISTRKAGFVDSHGIRWSGDEDYIDGTSVSYQGKKAISHLPKIYRAERYGNFEYAIPVPPGKYTVRLHFLESYLGSSSSSGSCWGAGCRVFDVSCNGRVLLKNFDIFKAAGGEYRPVVRTFYGLEPNGQGKLLLSFSPTINDAEVRAIEVIDEGGGSGKK